MARNKYRIVRLANFDKKQIYEYHDNRHKRRPIVFVRPKIITYQGGIFGELHYWR